MENNSNSSIITNNEHEPPPPSYRRKINVLNVFNQGLYYTLENVENDLPKIPLVRSQNIQKAKKNSVDVDAITPWYLKPIVSSTTDRAIGKPARVIKVKVGLRNQVGKRSETHIIFLEDQIWTGAVLGICMGVETGYIAFEKKLPASYIDVLGKRVEMPAQTSLIRPEVIFWRAAKRGIVAGLLFNFIEKNIAETRGKNQSDWINYVYTGAIIGSLYGLRGGFSLAMTAGVAYGVSSGIHGYLHQERSKRS